MERPIVHLELDEDIKRLTDALPYGRTSTDEERLIVILMQILRELQKLNRLVGDLRAL